jgi:hypothetical protein
LLLAFMTPTLAEALDRVVIGVARAGAKTSMGGWKPRRVQEGELGSGSQMADAAEEWGAKKEGTRSAQKASRCSPEGKEASFLRPRYRGIIIIRTTRLLLSEFAAPSSGN